MKFLYIEHYGARVLEMILIAKMNISNLIVPNGYSMYIDYK